jgi:hypothetical protein
MVCLLRWVYALCLVCLLLGSSLLTARASDGDFPFDHELMLDAAPIRGSKRIPIIEIAEDGAASIELWCTSVRGQASVSADSITIVAGQASPAGCGPERESSDATLLAALAQVTGWRRRGDVIEFLGATTLRFRLTTN